MGLALLVNEMNITNETVVIGLGDTGLSIASYLTEQQVPFKMVDTRAQPPKLNDFKQQFSEVEIYLGELNKSFFENVQQIIVSPGIDQTHPVLQTAIAQGAECFGDIELFVKQITAPIIAITGSNGKSTVTSLVTQMAQQAGVQAYAGGNLGPPALELLKFKNAELYVLELSSFQLESIYSMHPKVATVLNISPDHLDRHGDAHTYAAIKSRIYRNAETSVINLDDECVRNMSDSGNKIYFTRSRPKNGEFGVIEKNNNSFLAKGEKTLLNVKKLTLMGESGILNALAALAIGDSIHLPMDSMLQTLMNFQGLPHRLATVIETNNVLWVNDSKGTNIGATVSSLQSINNDIILIAGGVFKGGDLEQFCQAVSKHAKHVILFGQDADILQLALNNCVPVYRTENLRQSVHKAYALAQAGDTVLLSPACASFDMYENYIERGEDFENCVTELIAK